MRIFSTISGRVIASFATLVVLFALGAGLSFAGMAEIHNGLHSMRTHEEEARRAVELASAVRDQYAHQAHTIILGNASHLPLYEAARSKVQVLLTTVGAQPWTGDQLARVQRIAATADELDQEFREGVLPAVLAHDQASVQRHHDQVQVLVSRIEADSDAIARASLASIGSFEEHAATVQHGNVLLSVIVLAAATLFAAVIGFALRRAIANPVALLRDGADRVARGDLSTRIAIKNDDELGRLATQFNAMTAALKENQDKLVQSEKLAGIGRLAAGLAHEINNPLGVILGYARLLGRHADEGQLRDLRVIEDETRRCQQIVEGLLDLSRPMKLGGEAVDLRALAEDVVARLREAGQLSAIDVQVEGSGVIVGSPDRLRQVALNLIKNAGEAAGAGGSVRVSVNSSPDGVSLSIRDSGVGLSQEQLSRLFEPFFTTKPSGTGLGLAMSKAIAQAHGGDISAESGAPGALFTLRLPRREELGPR